MGLDSNAQINRGGLNGAINELNRIFDSRTKTGRATHPLLGLDSSDRLHLVRYYGTRLVVHSGGLRGLFEDNGPQKHSHCPAGPRAPGGN